MTIEEQHLATMEWLMADRDKYRQALLHGIANLENLCKGCEICDFIKGLHEAYQRKHSNA